MPWLLDTNAWIGYLKNPANLVATRLKQHPPAEIVVCSIVKAELFHGALKYGVPERRVELVRKTLAPYRSFLVDDLVAEHYSRIRHSLEITGTVIGPNDLFIAAICLANSCTLVTSNVGEFVRVAGLSVEDWNKP